MFYTYRIKPIENFQHIGYLYSPQGYLVGQVGPFWSADGALSALKSLRNSIVNGKTKV